MRHFPKRAAKQISEHTTSVFTDYSTDAKNLSLGVSEIHGRYPEAGYDVDTAIEQIWYVESGDGVVGTETETYTITPGDLVIISPNEKYWIQGTNLKLVVASSPSWFEDQHKHTS
ncbi:MAG TPA: AraC family ligand binding domain-containing protein [Candidatus Paceibacterota bacterium]|nr:AraC family ligand binding domain-containing protein [Candidatus Paceibacterota bacterium]